MKVNIGNQEIPLVLNYNSSILENLIDKKVAIVGSSGDLLDKEYGKEIDSHDIIVRFNVARVKGYEKHVGSRTDIRFFNGHAFAGTSDPQRFKAHDPNFVPNLNDELLIVKSWNTNEMVNGLIKNTPQNKVLFINPPFTQYCNTLVQNTEATCGLVGVSFINLFTKNISCYGFGHYKEDRTKIHYWEEVGDADNWKLGQSHSFSHEEKVFKYFEEQGLIKIIK
jgi:hypothetical protein